MSIAQVLKVSARGFKRTIAEAAGLTPAGNRLTVLPDDTFIVSYPRSGNTWLRFLLGNLLYGVNIDFDNMEEYIPDIYRNSNRNLLKHARPRILKSHEMYDKRYPRVIYIVRDGRDVAVSYYYYRKKVFRPQESFDEYMTNFIAGRLDGFGTWGGNILSWINNAERVRNGILILKYEDLLQNTYDQLWDILRFLEIKKSDEDVVRAIDASSFKQMRSTEISHENKSKLFKKTDKRIKFVRKGIFGEWREVFTPYAKQLFKSAFGRILIELGYENAFDW